MADAKLTALTAASALAAADLFYVSQSAASRKATGTQLLALVGTTYVPLAGGTMTGRILLDSTTSTGGIAGADSPSGAALIIRGGTIEFFNSGGSRTGLFASTGFRNNSDGEYGWSSSTDAAVASDLKIVRDAAATLAQRNGTTQQTFRLYNTYTDASNYERLTLTGVAGTSVNITAETLGTGGDNLDIVLTPAGSGSVKFPSSTGVNSTGYLTISGILAGGQSSVNYSAIGFRTRSDGELAWTSGAILDAPDTALMRNAAGVVEVNNGTAGTWRDLKLRNLLSTGYATIDSGTLTASAPALSITQTWNNAAVTFHSAVIDITRTAAGAASTMLDLRIAGVSKISFEYDASNYPVLRVGASATSGRITTYQVDCQQILSNVVDIGGYSDTVLRRFSAGKAVMCSGSTQQALLISNLYTDESNYEGLTLTGVAGTSVNITAETLGTGGDNLDIVLTPAGTGKVTFGTHSALAAETVTGYITIKDAGGTTRKLAVVS